jgi:hypothetical protein
MKKPILPVFLFFLLASMPAFAQYYSVLPQFASGSGWSSDLFLTNQGTSDVNGVVVSFYGDNGAPLSVTCNLGTEASFTFNINAGASQLLRVAPEGSQRTGYIVIRRPDNTSIRATGILRYEQGGVVQAELGIPQQFAFVHYTFPAEVNPSLGVNTGMALANPTFDSDTASSQTFLVNLISSNGTLQRTALITLAAGEHMSGFLNDQRFFGGLDNFVGVVSVSGAQSFGLLALRTDKQAYGAVAIDTGPILGPFTLNMPAIAEVEPNDWNYQAQYLTGNTLVAGSIGSAGDYDYYQFSGVKGDVISAIVDTSGMSSQLDSFIQLEKPDGTMVSQNDQNGLLTQQNDSFLQAVLPEDGTYYLWITDYFGNGGSDYTYKLHARVPTSTVPILPRINQINLNSAAQGTTANLVISGTNLGNANLHFDTATGVTISGLQSTSTQITAKVTIAANAPTGYCQVYAITASGASNMYAFTITKGGLDGAWSGLTSQGKTISFTVAGGVFMTLSYGGTVTGTGCSTSSDTTTDVNKALTSNSFSFNNNGFPFSTTYDISGTFASNNQANGTLKITQNSISGGPSCTGTVNVSWNATK